MIYYTEIKYVDANNGSDTTGDGTYSNPFKTIAYCKGTLTTTNPLINLKAGIYSITNLHTLSSTGRSITYKGKNKSTVLEVTNIAIGSYLDVVNIYNCVIRPSNTCTGDTRILSYTTDNKVVNFYNVCFTKSLNNSFPTAAFLFTHNSSTSYVSNKTLYNCSFIGGIQPAQLGSATFNSCAIQHTGTIGTVNNCKLSSLFNADYFIVDSNGQLIDNTLYGLYSGTESWLLFLIKYNEQYYSILNEYYDEVSKSYNPMDTANFNNGFTMQSLFNSITIGGDEFKPIDKFDGFSLVTNVSAVNLKLRGICTDKQMVVASDDISASIVEHIDSFTISHGSSGNGIIKLILSTDKGLTWKTWNVTEGIFEDVDLTIPLKSYQLLTESEKAQWDAATDIILSNGISPTVFNTLNFNLLGFSTIRFAYVLLRPSYLDVADTSQLNWQFDAMGSMRKMTDSECTIDIYDSEIKITSLIANSAIKINTVM